MGVKSILDAQINFRCLVYSPTNKQGVVLLLGKIAPIRAAHTTHASGLDALKPAILSRAFKPEL